MKKLVVLAAVAAALATAGSASAFPAIPPSCSDPFQRTCEFVTGGVFVEDPRSVAPGSTSLVARMCAGRSGRSSDVDDG